MGPIEAAIVAAHHSTVLQTALVHRRTEQNASQIAADLTEAGVADDPEARAEAVARLARGDYPISEESIAASEGEVFDYLMAQGHSVHQSLVAIGRGLDRLLGDG
jgi:hypothetical protein